MAFAIKQFVGFETGGLEEASLTSGTPTVQSSVKRTGTYALLLDASGDDYGLLASMGANGGNDYIIGFAVRFSTLSLASGGISNLLFARDDAVDLSFRLVVLNDSGTYKFRLQDAAGSTIATGSKALVVDTWYYVEIRHQFSASGAIDLYVDGASDISASGQDLIGTGTALTSYEFIVGTGLVAYIDDVYCGDGATGVSDFLGPGAQVLGAYANTAEDGTDQGSALDAGTWANLAEVPVSGTNTASYTGTPRAGHTRTDEGTKSGPAAAITGTAKAGKWFWRLRRGTGGGTTHTLRFGVYNGSTDNISTSVQALTASDANYFRFSTSNFPDSSGDYFLSGFEVSGAQDLIATETLCFLLHVAVTNVTINAALGVLTLTGLAADAVPGAVTVQSNVGVLVLTGLTATVANVTVIQTAVGILTLTGLSATITPGAVTVQSTLGILTLTGLAASVQSGAVTVQTSIGVLTFTGLAASIIAVTTIQTTLGILALTGLPATVSGGPVIVNVVIGVLTLTGLTATISVSGGAQTVNAVLAALMLTGLPAAIQAGPFTVQTTVGVLILTGLSVTVSAGGASQTINAALGALTLIGQSVTVSPGPVVLSTALGVLTLTGQTALISGVVTISAALGTLVLTGLPAAIMGGPVTVSAALGVLTLSGVSATIIAPGLFLPFIRVTIPAYITHESVAPFETDASVEPAESGGGILEYITHESVAPYRTDRTVP